MNNPERDAMAVLVERIFHAARTPGADSVALIDQALQAGLPVNYADTQGNSLLMLAAYHDNAAVLELLIERGADLNQLNDRGQSPVAGAVFKGNERAVAVLVAAGADLEAGHPTARATAELFGRTELLPAAD